MKVKAIRLWRTMNKAFAAENSLLDLHRGLSALLGIELSGIGVYNRPKLLPGGPLFPSGMGEFRLYI